MVQKRQDLEQWARGSIGIEIEPAELERIARRLESLKAALVDLEPLVVEDNEPLTMAALEDE